MRESLARRVKPFFFPLLLIGICAAGFIFRAPIVDLLGNRERLKAWVSSGGTWAPAVFFGLQVLQVVVFILPGEIVQVAGGFIFGFWGGAAISVAGIATGSMVNYFVGRTLGRSFVGALVGESKLSRLETMVADPKAVASYFILFLIPGLPKDILCYLAGLGGISPLIFTAVSMLGRFPGIAASTLMGSASSSGRYGLALFLLIISVLILMAGVVWRRRLEAEISLFLEKRRRR